MTNHQDRISTFGMGTVTGGPTIFTLTASSGTFQPIWLNHSIMINGSYCVISAVLNSTQVSVIASFSGYVPTGSCHWEHNTSSLVGSFYETDRKTIYVGQPGTGIGDLNHYTLTWVSGNKFTDYWFGRTVTVNGIDYIIATATETQITLTTDSGIVSSGLTWSGAECTVLAYQSGLVIVDLATLLSYTFTELDNGYTVYLWDYCHILVLNGISGSWAFLDEGSNYQVLGATGAPKGGAWVPSNGGSTTYLDIISGVPTAVSVTVPNNPGYYFRR